MTVVLLLGFNSFDACVNVMDAVTPRKVVGLEGERAGLQLWNVKNMISACHD
jgi:hypothetical protein